MLVSGVTLVTPGPAHAAPTCNKRASRPDLHTAWTIDCDNGHTATGMFRLKAQFCVQTACACALRSEQVHYDGGGKSSKTDPVGLREHEHHHLRGHRTGVTRPSVSAQVGEVSGSRRRSGRHGSPTITGGGSCCRLGSRCAAARVEEISASRLTGLTLLRFLVQREPS